MTDDTKQPAVADWGVAAGTRILGGLGSADGTGVVRIEDRYDTEPDDLWSAITDPRRVARWYGEVEGDLRPGGEFRIYLEGAGLHGAGRVEVCDPGRRLLVVTTETDESWRPGDGGLSFDESIEVVLTAAGDATTLVIEARGMPLDKVAFYGVGWQIHAEHLASYLAGQQSMDNEEARWEELIPAYQNLAAAIR